MLLGVRGHVVGRAAVLIRKSADSVSRPAGVDHVAEIAEAVAIGVGGDRRIEPHPIRRQQSAARRMHAQRQDHRRRLRAVVGNFVAGANLHRKTLRLAGTLANADPRMCAGSVVLPNGRFPASARGSRRMHRCLVLSSSGAAAAAVTFTATFMAR
jgi:hypothetical protein